MNLILLDDTDFLDRHQACIRDPRRLQHLHDVHHVEIGDTLTLGRREGGIGRGRLTEFSGQRAVFEFEALDQAPPAPLPIELILALPRPRMLARTLEHVTALGVKSITLMHTRRVEKSYWQSPELHPDKIHQHLVLGLEQARDTRLPSVSLEPRFKPFVEDRLAGWLDERQGLLAHPGTPAPCPRGIEHPTILVVGPEGGFIDYEVDTLLDVGCQGIHLGERILRVETAVIALLSRLA
ncbi:16S rRNA (uracil(1498)-N(3))-methyltransferase [Aidingimonas halophila]|uniref:Ribosomal RNA small subunit methyltransferase E n=1 Tax=Aidingimonas halophila TaxID=574349 RepID=A0A1H2UHP2_9GAMM|nr:16S rRNA (uracil(1498)-N(3))-methyltransferase [Aidingimonas halophila]GHC22652.1 ribosomal RNA small subunit methyltransferase E [Aidingimonas halophila]SDW55642.1 RNA methyltransferase, RsmE family [Aidingimonas halophila]